MERVVVRTSRSSPRTIAARTPRRPRPPGSSVTVIHRRKSRRRAQLARGGRPAIRDWPRRCCDDHQDRVKAIVARGYTERQARFLVLVMLHSGVCTVRQYCQFSGISRGQKSQDFFATLVARKHASSTADANGKLRVFHVYASALYDAIGEPENRNRKPTSMGGGHRTGDVARRGSGLQDTTGWRPNATRWRTSHALGLRFQRSDLPQLKFGASAETHDAILPRQAADRLCSADANHLSLTWSGGQPDRLSPLLAAARGAAARAAAVASAACDSGSLG